MNAASAEYPYLQAEHLPVSSESQAVQCQLEGEQPHDLVGTFALATSSR